MAIIPGRRFLVMNWMDSGRNQSSQRLQLINDEEDEDAELNASTAATAIMAALTAATDAALVSYFQYLEHVEETLVVPTVGQIEEAAALLFDVDGHPNKSATFNIHAPKTGVFLTTSGDGQNIVNTAAGIVQNVRDIFINTPGLAYLSDGEHMNSLIKGKKVHFRSRKG